MDEQDIEWQDERDTKERIKDELWKQERARRWQRLATREGARDLRHRVAELRHDLETVLRAFRQRELDAYILDRPHRTSRVTEALWQADDALRGLHSILEGQDVAGAVASFSHDLANTISRALGPRHSSRLFAESVDDVAAEAEVERRGPF